MKSNIDYIKQNFGEKYAQMVEEYIDTDTYLSPLDCLDLLLDKEQCNKVIEYLKDTIKTDREYAYFDGLREGVKYYNILNNDAPTIKYDEEVLKKDFTIVFDFHDNDFGNDVLNAAMRYVEKYNGIVNRINTYGDIESNNMRDYYFEKLKKAEDPAFITKFLSTACYCERILTDLSNTTEFCEKENIDEFHSDSKDTVVNYLGVNNIDNYVIGTYDEMEKYVMKKYESWQSKEKGEGKSLETCWMNGEVLFISMKDGVMKTWIQ